MTLEKTTDELLSYKQLGKELRRLIKEELKIGDYKHLTNPNNKKGVKIPVDLDQLKDMKCRFSIMPRKEFIRGKGRSTDLGRTEIILALYGNFANEENIAEGFQPQDCYKARILLGESFIDEDVKTTLCMRVGFKLDYLREGNYEAFVREMMYAVDKTISWYKDKNKENYTE